MSCVFIIVTQMSNDAAGYRANAVEIVVHDTNSSRLTLSPFRGYGARLREKSAPTNVVTAMIAANPKSCAKPHVRRCGLMTLNQTYISTPMYGRNRMKGSAPKATA